MVAYLNKSDASEGFNQVIDFLNASYIKYALTINPHIYVSCIKQFWNIVVVKQTNDITRLQALVDKKKVVITEATIRDALCLDDAEGVDCLPNEEIFAELARMGYEKPSTKLTYYKAFFSSQWKFLIYTILKSMSAKRTSWNEFSSSMESAVICLSTGRKFNFSKYIFKSLVRNVDSSSKFYMYPWFIQLIIKNQLNDLSTHTTKYTSPALTQKVFANMRRVEKGFSGVEAPLFEGMLVAGVIEEEGDAEEQIQDVADDPQPQSQPQAQQQAADFQMSLLQEALDACATLTRRVEHLEYDKVAQALEITKIKRRVKKLEKANQVKVLKLRRLKKVVTAASESVTTANTTIAAAEPQVLAATITAAPVRVAATSTRRRKEVVIRDLEEESSTIINADTKSKDKGKGIMMEEPKPLKKKRQVKMEEEYARKLHGELNKDIDWNVAIDHTEAQARKNMIMYLKNVVRIRLDYFKGMSYDDIHPIFEAKFNSNIEFLLKIKEQLEEEENRAIQSINQTPTQKAAKRRKLNISKSIW
uniref:Synaptobrevin, longin-like domain protein n=1 Tax=Tanacetum cinerariifolium TaxID=118510 RepID=A0A699I206_TANCI|nr:hypothetical protein [Tanacetum cinerariifolium]